MSVFSKSIALAALLPLSLGAQDICASARNLKPAGTSGPVTPAEVCRVLSVLAHDSLEGRATGSRGGAKAARFIAEEFKAAGLEPAGDSGYFQRVPIVITARGGRQGASAVPSFAARDTFPADRRGLAVNVVGILRGSDPVLKDSVILVDAHYDHLGVRMGPIDVDSARAYNDMLVPIATERAKWAQQENISLRGRGGAAPQLTDVQRAKLDEFTKRIEAIRVNMDSLRKAIPKPPIAWARRLNQAVSAD